MADPRPNILIIISDQLSQKAVGAYGDRFARTPHIDRIAARGVRFDKAYTVSPLCGPARNAFWTGLYPHQTGVLANAGPKDPFRQEPVSSEIPTLAEVFHRGGYRTAHFGQTYNGDIAQRGVEVLAPNERTPIEEKLPVTPGHNTEVDRYGTNRCVEFLRERHDRPFMAVLDLWNPHGICQWVGENAGPHEDNPLAGPLPPLPENFETEDLASRPLPIQYLCCSHNRLAQAAQWTESNYRHYLAAYYHYLEIADREIGRAIEALGSTPAAAHTLIVFMSDHGDGMTSHRMVTKQVCFYEEITRIPLVFAGPGIVGAGAVAAGPIVSQLDLFPTLCDYAGLQPPANLQGQSLLGWLRGGRGKDPRGYAAAEWHTEWGHTIEPGRMLRTERFKYARYVEGDGEELFDLAADPGERRNVAADPKYAAAMRQHRDLLAEHVKRTADPFFSLQPQADKRWRSHAVGYPNHCGPAAPAASEC